MPNDEKNTAQIERVFKLLVSQHPSFINHKIVNRWGWVQKKSDAHKINISSKQKLNELYLKQSIIPDIIMILRKVKHKIIG